MTIVYHLENVCFRYDKPIILDKISFSIHEGDFIGVIGDNGGGKTTLLRLFIGQLQPQEGKLFFLGKEGIHPEDRKEIGYVSQSLKKDNDFPISCEEMVALGLLRKSIFLSRSDKEKIRFSLKHLGVEHLARQNFHSLSGGQKQRVLLAKALVNQAKVLILDEPTVGMDEHSKDQLFEILVHMNKIHKTTIIMVTHEIDLAKKYWSRTFEVKDTKVVELC